MRIFSKLFPMRSPCICRCCLIVIVVQCTDGTRFLCSGVLSYINSFPWVWGCDYDREATLGWCYVRCYKRAQTRQQCRFYCLWMIRLFERSPCGKELKVGSLCGETYWQEASKQRKKMRSVLCLQEIDFWQ